MTDISAELEHNPDGTVDVTIVIASENLGPLKVSSEPVRQPNDGAARAFAEGYAAAAVECERIARYMELASSGAIYRNGTLVRPVADDRDDDDLDDDDLDDDN